MLTFFFSKCRLRVQQSRRISNDLEYSKTGSEHVYQSSLYVLQPGMFLPIQAPLALNHSLFFFCQYLSSRVVGNHFVPYEPVDNRPE